MTTRRFYCQTIPDAGGDVQLDPEESRHAARVLRLQEGDELDVLDGAGGMARGAVETLAGGGRQPRVTCRILSRSQSVPPALQIQLYVAPPRAKLMGTVVRQATELGIWRITPVLCDYSVARPDGEAVEKNWKAEALAALKQSGNPFLPEIERPCRFADVLPKSPCQGVFGDLQQGGVAAVRQALGGAGPVALWIGPEGGFSDREREALVAQGLLPVRLGQWILRVETAVPAMLGWLSAMAELGTAGSAVNVQNKRA